MINFQDFDFADNDRYAQYVKRCIQIPAIFSTHVLMSYREQFKIQRGYAADLCWHKAIDNDAEFWMPPAGDWDEINWQEVFAQHVPEDTTFIYVPEYLVKLWQQQLGAAIEIDEDRDNWDYILHIDRMEKLEGKKLKSIRLGRNTFEKNYNYTVEEITPKIFDELREFQGSAEKNLQARVEKLEDARDDDRSFLFALEHWDELKNLFGFVVRVDGKIVAYCLDELIDETYSVGLFAKANYDFKGANQFAYWYDAKINAERGVLTQNIMADIGEENLRFFKEHLYPLVMLKEYAVTYTGALELPTIQTREEHGLKISIERLGKNLTVKLSGKLDADAANWATNTVLTTLDGVEKIVFDLNALEHTSPSGLRILVDAMKKIRAQGGILKFIQTQEEHALKISLERLEKDLTISLSGKLNTDAANWSSNNILAALDGAEKVIFDLNGLEYISSSGLRILVAALKKIKSQGGTMTIKHVGEQVREVLDMTGFTQIFNVEA